MALAPDGIRHVAALARLALTEDELPRLAHDLSRILDHVSCLSELETSLETSPDPAGMRRSDEPHGESEARAANLISRSSGARQSGDGALMVSVPTVVSVPQDDDGS